jgi:hypothetical protein
MDIQKPNMLPDICFRMTLFIMLSLIRIPIRRSNRNIWSCLTLFVVDRLWTSRFNGLDLSSDKLPLTMTTLDLETAAPPVKDVRDKPATTKSPPAATSNGHRFVSGERAYYKFPDITFEVSRMNNIEFEYIP